MLLAIGLEQSVEAAHHHHERVTLRQDLRQEDEKALRDNADYIPADRAELVWLDQRIAAVQGAIRDHKAVAYLPPPKIAVHSTPDDPVWRAAKSSNLIEVMSQEDIKAYSEIDGLFAEFFRIHMNNYEPASALVSFEQQFRVSAQSPVLDFSSASRADLIEELRLLTSVRLHTAEEEKWALYSDGALRAVLAGERNLDRIDDAENSAVAKGSEASVPLTRHNRGRQWGGET